MVDIDAYRDSYEKQLSKWSRKDEPRFFKWLGAMLIEFNGRFYQWTGDNWRLVEGEVWDGC